MSGSNSFTKEQLDMLAKAGYKVDNAGKIVSAKPTDKPTETATQENVNSEATNSTNNNVINDSNCGMTLGSTVHGDIIGYVVNNIKPCDGSITELSEQEDVKLSYFLLAIAKKIVDLFPADAQLTLSDKAAANLPNLVESIEHYIRGYYEKVL